MNYKGILYYLGLFTFPLGFLSFLNIIYSSYFDYFLNTDSYILTLGISFFFGFVCLFISKNSSKEINFYEQLTLVILVYIFSAIIISIPFYFSNYQITFINSLFEAFSGLTTTGFTIFNNIKYLDPTLIIWRSSSQWIGGFYFLVFLILLFSNKNFNFKMTQLTYSGENNFSSEENIKTNVLKIFIIYSVYSLFFLILLNISNVRLFNSLNLSMTLVSGGGFLPTNNLGNIISSNFQKIIFSFLLICSILNIYLLFNLFNKKVFLREHKEDLYLIGAAIILILLVLFDNYDALNLIISTLSSLANSGLTTMQSETNLSLFFLFITILGGSLISNTSGIKLARFYILIKITTSEIIKLISPNSIINKTIFNSENKITDENIKISFLIFISFFISIFILTVLLIPDSLNFENTLKLSILTITNTTNSNLYGIESISFTNLITSSKISLIIFMVIAKIELISVFLLIKNFFSRN